MAKKPRVYGLYRGDELLGVGTYKELEKITGLTMHTMTTSRTNTYKKKNVPYERRLIVVDI